MRIRIIRQGRKEQNPQRADLRRQTLRPAVRSIRISSIGQRAGQGTTRPPAEKALRRMIQGLPGQVLDRRIPQTSTRTFAAWSELVDAYGDELVSLPLETPAGATR